MSDRPKKFVLRLRYVLAEKFDGTQECADRLCMWMTDNGMVSTIHKAGDGHVFIALHRRENYWLHPNYWLVWRPLHRSVYAIGDMPSHEFQIYSDQEFTGMTGEYDEVVSDE